MSTLAFVNIKVYGNKCIRKVYDNVIRVRLQIISEFKPIN